jgi:hypothetical protein
MTEQELPLDSTPAEAAADAAAPAEPARPETVAETVARTLQELNADAGDDQEDGLPEPPAPTSTEEADDEPDAELEETDEAEEEAPQLEALEPMNHWPAEFKDDFASMEPEAQHFMMRRYKEMEADYTKKTQGVAALRKRSEALDEILAPHRDKFARAGMDDVAAVRQLMAANEFLQKDPQNAIAWLANQYGVNVGAIGDDPAAEDEYADPQVKALQQQVNQLTGFIQNQQTQQQQSVQQSTQSLIDQFAAETDANGNPAYPHFEKVRSVMGTFISNGNAPDLKSAYEMAVYADPELRKAEMDNYALKKSQDTVKTDAVKKAKKAQRSKVRGSAAPAQQALPAGMSVRDTIMASIRQLENGR